MRAPFECPECTGRLCSDEPWDEDVYCEDCGSVYTYPDERGEVQFVCFGDGSRPAESDRPDTPLEST